MEPSGGRAAGIPPAKPRRVYDALRRPRWIVTIVVVAVVVVVTVLAIVPVSRTAHFTFRSSYSGPEPVFFHDAWPQPLCPTGAKAAVAFSSAGLNVTFGITAPNGTTIWSQHSPDANASFVVPTCGTYLILAAGSGDGTYSVDGTLSYSSPVL